jgi:hypothetical protein
MKSSVVMTVRINRSDGDLETTPVSDQPDTANRLVRRKQRTRAALIKSAQAFVAAGRLNVPVLEITQSADVGMGSFYNHFDSKEQLFEAAVVDVLDAHGAVLDQIGSNIDDPAETFAASFRLTGRFFRSHPQESRILLANWTTLMTSDRGLAPRALRDIRAAVAAGRFRVDDPERALAVTAGILLGLASLLQDPDRDDAHTTDALTEDLLRLLGMDDRDAHEICARALPDIALQE